MAGPQESLKYVEYLKYVSTVNQGWIYPVSHRSLRCKIEVLRCEIECDSQKIAMRSDLDRAKKKVVCMRFPGVHEFMHADCVPVCDQRSPLYAISFYLSRGRDSCYFPRMPYACRFLDFRVRSKLQLAFDRVRCWFVEVLLTSQLGR